ncbi:MAG: PQQ-dependent dehydrogenase, methanol/ethanol family [Sphingomonadaceae bacterium]|uniref:PQQ-dependent dehydrogenase, methanol/ethanol family n=1 Tax=Thermaurantiacus sp. TaxID=2820283 RepID=UPI00298F2C01|nr:PQQ-dependent dehydrogenase, methanol/ethanol family [Thermaurantiacus sp.]MCS6987528.1 PQQ-dependent dehydrogenase, methanol/ethanol family [Sphingomonadaceae bacterium]MDW8415129.1 PQQ-dependent dehydrogenase, methanol/ethanol family [Thermaurantiacus sp.]
MKGWRSGWWALALAACGGPPADLPTAERDSLARAGSAHAEWRSYGGTYDEQRHSRLKQIDTGNVSRLGVAWTYDLKTGRGVEATPIVADGVMYVTSAWSVLHALDAKTGRELWVHDPQVDRAVGAKACCDVVNRGVAIRDGVVFLGVLDGRLQALDARTGKLLWSVMTVDPSKPYTITGAPRVVKDMVLIGNGGAELGVRGYLSAYDVKTGALRWRFYTVPNPRKAPDGAASDDALARIANPTWGDRGAWIRDGGGGTVWDSIVYDEVNDQVIFGVGNGSPWNADVRDPGGGDNLFLSSIVAVDADTGAYRWHYQTTPRDHWDYTATQTIILADLPLGEGGRPRRVVMQAPKNGFFYVLDARTGAFLSGTPFVPQTWTTGLDAKGRPIEVKAARYARDLVLVSPGPLGAHNWQPMAFNPGTGLVYIPAQEVPQAMRADALFASRPVAWNTGMDFAAGLTPELPPGALKALRAGMKGRLIAWDPVRRAPRWTVEHEGPWNGGVLSTAGGLVFQGKLNGELVAYDAVSGRRLWGMNLKAGVAAPPVTYMVDGEQYVAVATGWGSAFALAAGFAFDPAVPPAVGRVVAFRLDAKGTVPDPPLEPIDATPKAPAFGDAKLVAAGMVHYARNCAVCHGQLAISSGVLPDLRWSPIAADPASWAEVVLKGALRDRGMVSFARYLTPADAEAVRAYVLHQAHRAPS